MVVKTSQSIWQNADSKEELVLLSVRASPTRSQMTMSMPLGGSVGARLGAWTCLLSIFSSLFFDVSQKILVLKINLILLLRTCLFWFQFLVF